MSAQYVEQYERLVGDLLRGHSRSDALSMAVGGGDFNGIGDSEVGILVNLGLGAGHSLFDVGCGSGRLAAAVSRRFGDKIAYTGTDIVDALLDHAKEVSHSSYRFHLHRELSVPAPDASQDFIVFFSVFTHLMHEQSYIYLRDARRALKPDGKIIFTFLEAEPHWEIFEKEVAAYGKSSLPMVMFIERTMVLAWAHHLRLRIDDMVTYPVPGQSLVALSRRD